MLDPNALLRTQTFRSDQDQQLVDSAELSVDPEKSLHGVHSKHGLCDWHKVSVVFFMTLNIHDYNDFL